MKFTEHEQAREDKWAADIKYHAARYAWVRRHKRTKRGLLWSQWFEKKFGENLNHYAERMKKDKPKPCQDGETEKLLCKDGEQPAQNLRQYRRAP